MRGEFCVMENVSDKADTQMLAENMELNIIALTFKLLRNDMSA